MNDDVLCSKYRDNKPPEIDDALKLDIFHFILFYFTFLHFSYLCTYVDMYVCMYVFK